jgi:hypothetical protein
MATDGSYIAVSSLVLLTWLSAFPFYLLHGGARRRWRELLSLLVGPAVCIVLSLLAHGAIPNDPDVLGVELAIGAFGGLTISAVYAQVRR